MWLVQTITPSVLKCCSMQVSVSVKQDGEMYQTSMALNLALVRVLAALRCWRSYFKCSKMSLGDLIPVLVLLEDRL